MNTLCKVFLSKKLFFGSKSTVIKHYIHQEKTIQLKKKGAFKEDGFGRAQPNNAAWWRKWRREGTEDRQQSLADPERAGETVRVPACHMVSRQAAEQDRRMETWTQKHHKNLIAHTHTHTHTKTGHYHERIFLLDELHVNTATTVVAERVNSLQA